MMQLVSKILRDPDSLGDAIGAFSLIAMVFIGSFAGEALGWWGQ